MLFPESLIRGLGMVAMLPVVVGAADMAIGSALLHEVAGRAGSGPGQLLGTFDGTVEVLAVRRDRASGIAMVEGRLFGTIVDERGTGWTVWRQPFTGRARFHVGAASDAPDGAAGLLLDIGPTRLAALDLVVDIDPVPLDGDEHLRVAAVAD